MGIHSSSIVIPLFLNMVRISCSPFMALSGNIWCRPSTSQTSWYIVCGTLWKTWSNKWWPVPYSPRVISDTSGRSWYHWQIHLVGGVRATGRWTTWKAAQKYGSPSECDSVNRAHNTKDATIILGRVAWVAWYPFHHIHRLYDLLCQPMCLIYLPVLRHALAQNENLYSDCIAFLL